MSQDIVVGNFGQCVQLVGFGIEFVEFVEFFNQMSGYVEDYVGCLQKVVVVNCEFFLGIICVLFVVIEVKEFYMCGYFEWVVSYSQVIV